MGDASKLVYLPDAVGEPAPKPIRLCGLDLSWPHLKFSGQTGTLGCHYRPDSFAFQTLSFSVFWPGFLVFGAGSFPQQWLGLLLSSHAREWGEGQLLEGSQVTLIRPAGWEGLGAALSCGWVHDLIPLPGHSRGTLCVWHWLCRWSTLLASDLLEHCWAMQLLSLLVSLCGQLGLGASLSSGSGKGRPGSMAGKSLTFRTQIRQTRTLLIFLVGLWHLLGSADEQRCWLGLLQSRAA